MPTEQTWIYDARSNGPRITKKDRPLTSKHFADFEACFGPDPFGRAPRDEQQSADGRWRSFGIQEIKKRNYTLDSFRWLRDDADEDDVIAEPEELITEAIEELRSAVDGLVEIQELIEVPAAGGEE